MISVMLRSLRRVCNAIFCYYYFQFYSWRLQLINIDIIDIIKSIFIHLISFNLAAKIVFQFRKRCTLPTCAMGHRARNCWRRFSSWPLLFSMQCIRSLDCIKKIFAKNRLSFDHFIYIFCIIYSINEANLTWWMRR